MGKMALLVVMSLSVAVGIITYTINRSKNSMVENVSGFQKYCTARDIAHTGVNMMMSRIDTSDTSVINHFDPNKPPAMKIFNISAGICTVRASLANVDTTRRDSVYITARSRFMDTTRYMKILLNRQPVPFPTVGEALGLRVPNVIFSIVGGGSGKKGFIDGRNYDINGNLITPDVPANDKPGVGVMTPSDTTQVLAAGANINGTKDVVVDTTMFNPTAYVDQYINAADYVLNAGNYSGGIYGTTTAPKIVYCTGDVKFTGLFEGCGILVVHGNLNIAGGMNWRGLVIAYKETTIDVTETGGSGKDGNIIGGVLVAGPSGSSYTMKGSQNTFYSKDALELAKYINKLQAYRVLYWYE